MSVATLTIDAVLFDMDGTLIDSTPGVFKAWDIFARDYALDGVHVAHATHGRRLCDSLVEFCGLIEPTLSAEVVRFEELVIEGGPIALPGAKALLEQISASSPTDLANIAGRRQGWTIVTSATSVYTPRALAKCAIPLPSGGYVTSNDVTKGKPFADPYLAGAVKCGVDPSNCLVFEDAPAGIRSGRAAGARTVAVCTSHTRRAIEESGADPDFIVDDLTKVSASWVNGKLRITIDTTDHKT